MSASRFSFSLQPLPRRVRGVALAASLAGSCLLAGNAAAQSLTLHSDALPAPLLPAADVQRLSYEPKPALPDARELEQAALRTLELSYEVCSRFHTKEKARAVAVKDTKRLHNLSLSHLLTRATPT